MMKQKWEFGDRVRVGIPVVYLMPEGDRSMWPNILPADEIFVYRQAVAEPGDLVVAVADGLVVVRVFFILPDGRVILRAYNEAAPDLEPVQFAPFGVVGCWGRKPDVEPHPTMAEINAFRARWAVRRVELLQKEESPDVA